MRANEERDGSKMREAAVNRADERTRAISLLRVELARVSESLDIENRVYQINRLDIGVAHCDIQPWGKQHNSGRLGKTRLAQLLRQCQCHASPCRIPHKSHIGRSPAFNYVLVEWKDHREHVISARGGCQGIVGRGDGAAQGIDEPTEKAPMLGCKAIDVGAAMQIVDMLAARAFPGCESIH